MWWRLSSTQRAATPSPLMHCRLVLSGSLRYSIETVIDALVRSIRKGGGAETAGAANALAKVFLSSIVDDAARFDEVSPVLQEAIRRHGNVDAQAAVRAFRRAAVRAWPFAGSADRSGRPTNRVRLLRQCVGALAMCCILASTEMASTEATLDFLEDIFTNRSTNDDVAAAAVDAWGLIAPTVTYSRLQQASPR